MMTTEIQIAIIGFMSAIIGGVVGGILGVVGTLVSSYYGPKKIEEWREKRLEEKENGPRKKLLKQLLSDPAYEDGRLLSTLCLVTGTTDEECRRLLIEIGARGVRLSENREGWALISRKPITEQ